jgi:hypothetical protein
LSLSKQGPLTSSFKHCNDILGPVKTGGRGEEEEEGLLDCQSDSKLLKMTLLHRV